MPVERRSTSAQVRTIIIAVASLILVAVTVWVLVARSPFGRSDDTAKSTTNGGSFPAGSAERLSGQIERTGPLLFSDVSGRGQSRPIILNHVGDGWKNGWVAFDALEPGQGEGCFIQVSPDDRKLYGSCTDTPYPADGAGLRQYPAAVNEDGWVVIDLTPDGPTGATGPS